MEDLPPLKQWIIRFAGESCHCWGIQLHLDTSFVWYPCEHAVNSGYLLREYIEASRGHMLSSTQVDDQYDIRCRANVFQSLVPTMLNISQVRFLQLARLPSTTKDFGVEKWPIIVEYTSWRANIPTSIHRHFTYSTVDPFIVHVLILHSNHFHYELNVVNGLSDCVGQLSDRSAMRTVSKLFFREEFRRRPFPYYKKSIKAIYSLIRIGILPVSWS